MTRGSLIPSKLSSRMSSKRWIVSLTALAMILATRAAVADETAMLGECDDVVAERLMSWGEKRVQK